MNTLRDLVENRLPAIPEPDAISVTVGLGTRLDEGYFFHSLECKLTLQHFGDMIHEQVSPRRDADGRDMVELHLWIQPMPQG